MMWLLMVVALVALFFLYNNKLYKNWNDKGVRQTSYFPLIVDNFDVFVRNRHFYEMVTSVYNKFPGLRYIGQHQFTKPVLMLRDPELIKQINVKDFEHFLDHGSFLPDDADPMWNKNLFALKGQKWKDMRSTLSPAFTGSKLRQMFVLMFECAENFVNYFAESSEEVQELELKDIFSRYTNDIIATIAFGIKCDSLRDRDNEFFLRGRQSTDLTGFWRSVRFSLTVLLPRLGKIFKGNLFDEDARIFFRKVIKETVEYREQHNIERHDMLNLLMQARRRSQDTDEHKKIEEADFAAVDEHLEMKPRKGKMDLSLDDITSQALVFFSGGFETISTAMCFIAYELAVNLEVQKKLIEEIDAFRVSNKISYDGLVELTYLDMVVSETLRKWPTVIASDRQCLKPYTIPPVHPDEKPVTLTPCNSIFIPIWAIHHDPKYWENPEKFDPDRFSPENKHKIIPYAYLPFGLGPRRCIASRFALTELKAAIFTILSKFEIVPTEKSCIPFVSNKKSFNLVPANGFWFGLKKRRTTEL